MPDSFSMYKYFKGEKENPFDKETQNTACNFWWYESIFEGLFAEKESSDWFAFFSDHGLGDKFTQILTEKDYQRPGEDKKEQVFELWLDYLFEYKLYEEYGGENWHKEQYFALAQ